ncbi:hypothetical protein C8J56DRAFT_888494 [Mycena floridula]|nr:hypothetical protein C8J56DRAFT_888494 [Mycena floridula]
MINTCYNLTLITGLKLVPLNIASSDLQGHDPCPNIISSRLVQGQYLLQLQQQSRAEDFRHQQRVLLSTFSNMPQSIDRSLIVRFILRSVLLNRGLTAVNIIVNGFAAASVLVLQSWG